MHIDWSTAWDAMSAIGTISASVIALWLGLKDSRKCLECALVWDGTTQSQPTLVINNPSKKMIVLKEITIMYKKKKIKRFKLSEAYHLLNKSSFSPNDTQTVKLPPLEGFDLASLDSARCKRMNSLKVELIDISGKKYSSMQRITDDEIYSLTIGQTMLSD